MLGDAVIRFSGALGADPDLRVTKNGKPVCGFSVAVSGREKQPDGTWTDGPTTWLRVTAWGTLGEHVAESLHKGDRVLVEGEFCMREWEDSDGAKRLSPEVNAREVAPSLMFAIARPTKVARSS